eukprot:Colp12_sorted_trinity150504_noHs@8110
MRNITLARKTGRIYTERNIRRRLVDSQIALVVLNALEQVLKVALAESTASGLLNLGDVVDAADSLNDLEEDGGSVPDGLGEDLHEDALVVLVDQDAHLLRRRVLLLREGSVGAQLHLHALVVVVRLAGHELVAAPRRGGLHHGERLEDVVGQESHVLHALALVLLEVCLDLGLALGAEGGLVHGEQDHLVVVGEHGAVEAAVHGADILRSELGKVVESSHVLDVGEGGLEVVYVADNVVHSVDAVLAQLGAGSHDILEVRQEGALEVRGVDEAQGHVAVQLDLGEVGIATLGVGVNDSGGSLHHDAAVLDHDIKSSLDILHGNTNGIHGEAVLVEECVCLGRLIRREREVASTFLANGVVGSGEKHAAGASLDNV